MKKIHKKTYHLLNEEINRLVEKGYDRSIVENELFEVLVLNEYDMSSINTFMSSIGQGIKNVGSYAGEGLIQTAKKRIAKFVIGKLGIVDENSFTGLVIQNAFANISIADYNKLTDCRFVTKHIAKALVESMIDAVREKEGLNSLLYDALKETLVEAGSNSAFYKGLENKLIDIVCPIVKLISKKFSSFFS
jgi:hypothetical protein